MLLQDIDILVREYKKELDEECIKGYYKGSFDKASMMLWGAFEMLLFLNKRGLLGASKKN